MKYLSVRQVAEKWGISKRRVQTLCTEGRIEGAIEGAMRVDSFWVIPEDTEKPKDERIKNGKYIKKKEKPSDENTAVEK